MRVLLWSICSPWTINFVENFLVKNNYEVWILNTSNKKESKEYIDFFESGRLHLVELPPLISEINEGKAQGDLFKNFHERFLRLKTIIKSGPFDVINMQFVRFTDLADVILLKYLMKSKLILSYWGSDLFRVNRKELTAQGKYIRHADFITFDNIDLEIEFKKIYRKKIPSKVVLFGLPVLDIIDKTCRKMAGDDIRRQWGIAKDKMVIAIGYNGIPQQQHKKILSAISKLDKQYKEKVVLLLQMSYGGSREYRKSVINAVKKTGYEYIVIQHFLSNDEVAELRIITDIFINAQTTDAFSGSVCEYLFANTILINAKWLRYKEFEKYNFQYLEFQSFNEIPLLISQVMEKEIDVSKNKELVWKLRSWEYCAPRWKEIYKRMCK